VLWLFCIKNLFLFLTFPVLLEFANIFEVQILWTQPCCIDPNQAQISDYHVGRVVHKEKSKMWRKWSYDILLGRPWISLSFSIVKTIFKKQVTECNKCSFLLDSFLFVICRHLSTVRFTVALAFTHRTTVDGQLIYASHPFAFEKMLLAAKMFALHPWRE